MSEGGEYKNPDQPCISYRCTVSSAVLGTNIVINFFPSYQSTDMERIDIADSCPSVDDLIDKCPNDGRVFRLPEECCVACGSLI